MPEFPAITRPGSIASRHPVALIAGTTALANSATGLRLAAPIIDPEPPAHVEPGDRVAHRPEPGDDVDRLARRAGVGLGRRDLRADVHVDADHRDRLQPLRPLGQGQRAVDVHAELRLLLARRDVPVRLGVDVRVDPQGHRRDLTPSSPATRAMASSSASLSTLNIRTPAFSPAAISSSVLPTPAKTVRPGSPPATSTRYSSPPETTSNPLPCSAITRRIDRFEFALTE